MILWLDHLIFGNGRGIKSPYWDNRFYWLSGELYTFFPGLGAQLHSWQWRAPKVGERRRLAGRDWIPLSYHRRWGRVMISWAVARLPRDLNEANAMLREVEAELGRYPV